MYVRNSDPTRSLWNMRGQRCATGLASSSSRLTHMISEFERALRGTPPSDAWALKAKIRAARSKHDLWFLRTDIQALVKQAFDHWEAQVRLRELEALFDSAGPRSVLFPL
jgi:hypothetical protein